MKISANKKRVEVEKSSIDHKLFKHHADCWMYFNGVFRHAYQNAEKEIDEGLFSISDCSEQTNMVKYFLSTMNCGEKLYMLKGFSLNLDKEPSSRLRHFSSMTAKDRLGNPVYYAF